MVFFFYKDVAPKELLLIGIKLCDHTCSTYGREIFGKKNLRETSVFSVSLC